MAAYLFVQVRVIEPDGWAVYRRAVGPLAERFGGRWRVRGATVEVLEGSHDGRSLVVLEFPSMQAIRAFWASPEYGELRKVRAKTAQMDAWAVPGPDEPAR